MLSLATSSSIAHSVSASSQRVSRVPRVSQKSVVRSYSNVRSGAAIPQVIERRVRMNQVAEDANAEEDNTIQEIEAKVKSSITEFPLAPRSAAAFNERGITDLFPVQAETFHPVYDGHNVIVRARTGTGKTLAFVLPIAAKVQRRSANAPQVLVLSPTRELAKQTATEFATFTDLTTCTIYGGQSYRVQEDGLRRSDVVVGTPGRMIDHLKSGQMNISQLKFVVIDEADAMLQIGFEQQLDEIFTYLGTSKIQYMLFSATIPSWVVKTARKFLKPSYVNIDLIGKDEVQTADTIIHEAVACERGYANEVIVDLINSKGRADQGGRTIIFTETKRDCDMISRLPGIRGRTAAIHGDITQAQREAAMEALRNNQLAVMVATDVAARGIDIPNVDLVLQFCPDTFEKYIHRSGRTGRAGQKGTSVLLYNQDEEGLIPQFEQQLSIKFKRVGVQSANDSVDADASTAIGRLHGVDPIMIEKFQPYAERTAQQFGGDSVKALAATLAMATGHIRTQASRSLLTGAPGIATFQAVSTSGGNGHEVLAALRSGLGHVLTKHRMTKNGVVFDVEDKNVGLVQETQLPRLEVSAVDELPEFSDSVSFTTVTSMSREKSSRGFGGQGRQGGYGQGGYGGQRQGGYGGNQGGFGGNQGGFGGNQGGFGGQRQGGYGGQQQGGFAGYGGQQQGGFGGQQGGFGGNQGGFGGQRQGGFGGQQGGFGGQQAGFGGNQGGFGGQGQQQGGFGGQQGGQQQGGFVQGLINKYTGGSQ